LKLAATPDLPDVFTNLVIASEAKQPSLAAGTLPHFGLVEN
jgi:hypothetical protein